MQRAMSEQQKKTVLEQFTKQAVPFANSDLVRNDHVLNRIVRRAELMPGDLCLDVACGPGLLVCAVAPFVQHAVGIDLTPAMLAQAKELQSLKKLPNVTWVEGDVAILPFANESFSVVISRYAFHHFADPRSVLGEMHRVCKPGGRLLLVDSSPDESKASEFNRIERLRDPSHVRALTEMEFRKLFAEHGVPLQFVEKFRLAGELESLLARSFPRDGNAEAVREAFAHALMDDLFDVCPCKSSDNEIFYSFPIILMRGEKRL